MNLDRTDTAGAQAAVEAHIPPNNSQFGAVVLHREWALHFAVRRLFRIELNVYTRLTSFLLMLLMRHSRYFAQLYDCRQRCIPRYHGKVVSAEAGVFIPGRTTQGVSTIIWRSSGNSSETVRVRKIWCVELLSVSMTFQ